MRKMMKLFWLAVFLATGLALLAVITTLFQWLLGNLFKPGGVRNLPAAAALVTLAGFYVGWNPQPDHGELALGAEWSAPNLLNKEQQWAKEFVALQQHKLRLLHPHGSVPRDVHGTMLACHRGEFRVVENLPAPLAAGLFAGDEKHYPALIRFSFAEAHSAREKDFLGMALKLRNVPGPKLQIDPTGGDSQDFLLVSGPVFPMSSPADLVALARWRLTRLQLADRTHWTVPEALWDLPFFLAPRRWQALAITLRYRSLHVDPLQGRYWSQVPYRLGADAVTAVKYHLRPCRDDGCPSAGPDQQILEFMLQRQTDPGVTPIEDPSVLWRETDAPFERVALLAIEVQREAGADRTVCDDASFSPWHSLADHRPLGGMNRVRRHVYREMARFRREAYQ